MRQFLAAIAGKENVWIVIYSHSLLCSVSRNEWEDDIFSLVAIMLFYEFLYRYIIMQIQ